MKIVKRVGVFETNSSSVHAVSIGTVGSVPKLYEGMNINIKDGEYGWGYDCLKTPLEKASYLFTLCSTFTGEAEEIKEMVTNAFKESGASEVNFSNIGGYGGYVDHGGEKGKLIQFVTESQENMNDFLFGDGVVVLTNDNNDDWTSLIEMNGFEIDRHDGWEDIVQDKYHFWF